MLFFIIIGGILVFAIAVVGSLFYMLRKESEDTSKLINELKQAPKVSSSSLDPKTNPFLDVPVITNPLEAPEVLQMSREFAEKEAAFQNKVERLEIELKDISDRAQAQSKEALDAVEKLKKENEELKELQRVLLTSPNTAVAGAQETALHLGEDQGALQSRLAESQQRAVELQEEVTALKHQMSREIDDARAQAQQLTEDNERLRSSLEAVAAEATRGMQDELSSLRQENEALKKANQEAALLNQSLQQVPAASAADGSAFQDEIDELKRQVQALKATNNDLLLANQGLKISAESALAEATSTLQDQLEQLSRENELLKNAAAQPAVPASVEADTAVPDEAMRNELELSRQRVNELNEQNEHLNARIESLQWDLTKTKAQMTGFERACANYEIQLKEALEKKGS